MRPNIIGLKPDPATATLRPNEALYSALVKNFPNGVVFMLDRDMRIVMFGGQGMAQLGFTTEEVVGKLYAEVFGHLPAFQTVTAMFERVMTGEAQEAELEVKGRTRWTQIVPIREEGAKVSLALAMSQDITELKRAETERQDRREALQMAHDDLERRVSERTAELETLNRVLHGQIAERQMVMGALHETVRQLEQAKSQVETANEELRANEALLLQGNHIFTGLTRLRVNSDAELGSALQVLTEAGCQLLSVARCSVWLFREDGTRFSCLDSFDSQTRQHSRDVSFLVKDFPAYFHTIGSGKPIMANDVNTHPATIELSRSYFRPLHVTSTLDVPILNNGQIEGVLCFEHSGAPRVWKVEEQTVAVSAAAMCALAFEWRARAGSREELHWAAQAAEAARREAEHAREDAEAAREDAERANRAKSEFLSRMSHELRTPLNSILGFAQIMEMHAMGDAEKQSQRVGYILKAGQHLLQLINEVLDIAHVESGHLSLSLESVSIGQSILDAIHLAIPLCGQNALEMTHAPSEADASFVRADRQRLAQVLLNLLSNAVKYNRYGGRVWVRSQVSALDWVRISVHDTGNGVEPDAYDRIFLPFERLGAEMGLIEGTGLGLSLSRRLIEAMGGRMGLQSVVGQGSEFWIELPMDTEPATQIEKLPSAYQAFRDISRQHTVLYVEDNLANLQVIEHMLEDLGNVKLVSAMQGQMGLELARQHQPSLILLDLHLPDLFGDEVLQRLDADPLTRDIPTVVISADATPQRIQRLRELGAADYLTKPLDIRAFLDVVHRLLRQREWGTQ